MTIFLFIGSAVLLTAGILCSILGTKDTDTDFSWWGGNLVAWGILALVGALVCLTEEPKPTAMDVYQNKTTLQYTIQDSAAIDSVVVFKPGLVN